VSKPARLLTVARAVEKKGLDTLIAALAALPTELNWTWTHVGGGDRVGALKAQAEAAGIAARCAFRGAQDQSVVLELYRSSDLFVLPCRIASDGDRDGLPNVLVEAASQGLCVVSTPVSGIVEFIQNDVTGALVPADDSAQLSECLAALIRDPTRRYRLGKAAMAQVRSSFDHATTIVQLRDLFVQGAEAGRAEIQMEAAS
jgi:glycosyltransferase involved in cell wall biosynthesis